jgi:hypothetical protein
MKFLELHGKNIQINFVEQWDQFALFLTKCQAWLALVTMKMKELDTLAKDKEQELQENKSCIFLN